MIAHRFMDWLTSLLIWAGPSCTCLRSVVSWQVGWRLIGLGWPQLGTLGSSPHAPSSSRRLADLVLIKEAGRLGRETDTERGVGEGSWDLGLELVCLCPRLPCVLLIKATYKATQIQRTGKQSLPLGGKNYQVTLQMVWEGCHFCSYLLQTFWEGKNVLSPK